MFYSFRHIITESTAVRDFEVLPMACEEKNPCALAFLTFFNVAFIVETEIKHEMIEALKDGFKNDTITTEHSISNAWNHLFMKLECCGVNSVVSTTNDFDDTPWCTSSGTCLKTGLQIPRTCCKNVDESSYIFAPSHCYAKIVRGTYNDKGCYDELKDKLLSLKPWIIGGVVLLEIFAVALAIMVRRQGSNYEKAYIY